MFSQTTGYAILALTCLACKEDAWVLASQIAECTSAPPAYLRKILHALVEAGLVEAKRGYRGGYRLLHAPDDVSLARIVAAVEGREWEDRCLLGLAPCSDERFCPLHRFWKAERARVASELENTSLEDIASCERVRGGSSCVRLSRPGGPTASGTQADGRRPEVVELRFLTRSGVNPHE